MREWEGLRKCQVIPGKSQESWRASRVEPCLNIKGKSDSREGFKRARGSFRIKLDNVSKAPTGPNTEGTLRNSGVTILKQTKKQPPII